MGVRLGHRPSHVDVSEEGVFGRCRRLMASLRDTSQASRSTTLRPEKAKRNKEKRKAATYVGEPDQGERMRTQRVDVNDFLPTKSETGLICTRLAPLVSSEGWRAGEVVVLKRSA